MLINRVRLKTVDASSLTLLRRRLGNRSFNGHRSLSMHPVWGIPILLAVLFLMSNSSACSAPG